MLDSPPCDALIVGAGLAGLVAAAELVDAGKKVTILEQEPEANFGGRAWWSFGGIFLIDSPEQRRLGSHDSIELARQDWFASAGFDRDEHAWPKRWAEAYLDFAGGCRQWPRHAEVSPPSRRTHRAGRRRRGRARCHPGPG